ncbi:hypothetical protein ACF0H5_015789 [Mactra antiquata]
MITWIFLNLVEHANTGIQNAVTETHVTVESFTSTNESFGSFTVGPLDDYGGLNDTSRVTCVQIKCLSSAYHSNYCNIKVHPTIVTEQSPPGKHKSNDRGVVGSIPGRGILSWRLVME